MIRPGMPPAGEGRKWNLCVGLVLIVSVVAPLLFGLPILGVYTAMDANFALQLVHGYTTSIAALDWFPRWLAAGNAGLGSPVFYYYGRLPFCLAALLALGLHLSAATALLVGIGLFRFLAFFTCRAWLRLYAGRAAADCGALLFVSLPFAMSYNPIGRLGFAETAATALIPLLFLAVARIGDTWRSAARQVSVLALLYAVLAATHLPQTLLAIAVTAVYGALLHGGRAFLVNLLGAACGLLLSAPNVLPALTMQSLISPLAWTGSATGDVRSQFLFTISRFHLYHFLGQEVYLYSTWLLCLVSLLPFALSRSLRSRLGARPSRAAAITLLACLLAMTKLFWPVWVYLPQLRALQFPWRLFPATMALAAAVTATLAASRERQVRCFVLTAGMVGVQAAIAVAGGFVSLSNSALARSVPPVLALRLPLYVPPSQRDTPAYALQRSAVPEYIPASARTAGWHLDDNQRVLLQGQGDLHYDFQTPPSLQETKSADGAIELHGLLADPATFLLPSFFFPDEEVSGSPSASVLTLDQRSGLTRLTLPAGPVALHVDHEAATPSVKASHLAELVGFALLLGLVSLSFTSGSSHKLPMRAGS